MPHASVGGGEVNPSLQPRLPRRIQPRKILREQPGWHARALRKQSEIAPAIEVDLDREPHDRAAGVEGEQLLVIGVAPPDDAIEQRSVGGVEANEIVAAATPGSPSWCATVA